MNQIPSSVFDEFVDWLDILTRQVRRMQLIKSATRDHRAYDGGYTLVGELRDLFNVYERRYVGGTFS